MARGGAQLQIMLHVIAPAMVNHLQERRTTKLEHQAMASGLRASSQMNSPWEHRHLARATSIMIELLWLDTGFAVRLNITRLSEVSMPPDVPDGDKGKVADCGPDEDAIARLRWPLITIDFEASSLEVGSLPIEAGVCRWTQPDLPLETWSALIKPESAWLQRGSWSDEAQHIHNIRGEELDRGLSCTEIAGRLNVIVDDHVAFCDGGHYDLMWLQMLSRSSHPRLRLRYGDFGLIREQVGTAGEHRLRTWLARNPAPHRAGPDAVRLMRSIAEAIRIDNLRADRFV